MQRKFSVQINCIQWPVASRDHSFYPFLSTFPPHLPCVAKNWWALGLTMAIGLPALFELALGLGFRLQVHE